MANITLRTVKGSALTTAEMDNNLSDINDELPKTLSYDESTRTLSLTTVDNSTIDVDLTDLLDESTGNSIAMAIALGGE